MDKKGKLYLKFIVAVAVIAAALSSFLVLAAVPSSTPVITNTNGTAVNGVFQLKTPVLLAYGDFKRRFSEIVPEEDIAGESDD